MAALAKQKEHGRDEGTIVVYFLGMPISGRNFILLNVALGFTVLIATRWYLGTIFDLRVVCEDGWRSPSIGTQGACSSHGGVDRSAVNAAITFSIFFAILIVYLSNKIGSALAIIEFKEDLEAAPESPRDLIVPPNSSENTGLAKLARKTQANRKPKQKKHPAPRVRQLDLFRRSDQSSKDEP
ncbi:MAG: hypothetical protein ACT4OK_08405 [Gemmobacter sp.]